MTNHSGYRDKSIRQGSDHTQPDDCVRCGATLPLRHMNTCRVCGTKQDDPEARKINKSAESTEVAQQILTTSKVRTIINDTESLAKQIHQKPLPRNIQRKGANKNTAWEKSTGALRSLARLLAYAITSFLPKTLAHVTLKGKARGRDDQSPPSRHRHFSMVFLFRTIAYFFYLITYFFRTIAYFFYLITYFFRIIAYFVGSPILLFTRKTQRPQNQCSHCGYTWYPRGKDVSLSCPSCSEKTVVNLENQTAEAVGWILLLIIGLFLLVPSSTPQITPAPTEEDSGQAKELTPEPNLAPERLTTKTGENSVNSKEITNELDSAIERQPTLEIPDGDAELRLFTDSSGEKKTLAKFIEFSSGKAILEKENGNRITLSMNDLSFGDQQYIRNMLNPDLLKPYGKLEHLSEFHLFKDDTGDYTVTAKFFDFKNGKVILEKEDSSLISLSMTKLSADDQQYVQDILKRIRESLIHR